MLNKLPVDTAILREHSLNSREKDTGKVKFGQEILNATSMYFGEVSFMVILTYLTIVMT